MAALLLPRRPLPTSCAARLRIFFEGAEGALVTAIGAAADNKAETNSVGANSPCRFTRRPRPLLLNRLDSAALNTRPSACPQVGSLPGAWLAVLAKLEAAIDLSTARRVILRRHDNGFFANFLQVGGAFRGLSWPRRQPILSSYRHCQAHVSFLVPWKTRWGGQWLSLWELCAPTSVAKCSVLVPTPQGAGRRCGCAARDEAGG